MARLNERWWARSQIWVEAFVILNVGFLTFDIYLAHSVNQFRNGAEYIPLFFSATAPIVLIFALALRYRWPAVWKDLGYLVVWGAVLPFAMNTAGWLLTESGRQPWIVQGIMLTKNGISPTVSTTTLWISLIAFILLYGTLATVDLILMLRYSREQLPPPRAEADADAPVPAVLY